MLKKALPLHESTSYQRLTINPHALWVARIVTSLTRHNSMALASKAVCSFIKEFFHYLDSPFIKRCLIRIKKKLPNRKLNCNARLFCRRVIILITLVALNLICVYLLTHHGGPPKATFILG